MRAPWLEPTCAHIHCPQSGGQRARQEPECPPSLLEPPGPSTFPLGDLGQGHHLPASVSLFVKWG